MFDRRLGLLYLVFCAALLCIGARLFQLQVLGLTSEDPDAVLRRPLPLEEVPAARGTIFDRDGTVLACDQPTLELTIQYGELLRMCALGGNSMFPEERERIREAEKRRPIAEDSLRARLDALAEATGCDRDFILARVGEIVNQVRQVRRQALGDHEAEFGKRMLYEETLPHVLISGVSIETAERAAAGASRFPGVAVSAAWRRTYPQGKSAAHVVGYLGRAQSPSRGETPEDPDVRPGDHVGIAGAEKQFDSVLRGVPGIVNAAVDPKTGRLARNVLFPAQAGRNLYLALHGPAQRQAEEALAGLVGAAVVMDLRTGELLVLASSPSFDPAKTPSAEDPALHADLSRATQDSVAPGSVFKPVAALAAAAGGFGTERTLTCNGTFVYGGVTFHCEGHHGAVNMAQALAVSCNIYFFQVARQTRPDAILAWASALNLGRRTGVDLPYEWAGRLPQLRRDWPVGQTMNLGIGQGDLSVTPLQVAVMTAVIANGGKSPRPTILHRIEPPPEADAPAAADAVPPCEVSLPSEGLRAVKDGMRWCTLTGTASNVPGLRELKAAVKTGTAETRDRTINQAWIAGYLPWDSPRWAFAVVVHNVPGYGAAVAGPIASATLQALSAKPE
jgi:penicillin-binding protein 2